MVLALLGRVWIPLVVIAVLAAGGLAVSRLHSIFGNEKTLSYGDTKNDKGKPYNPKKMKYEVFGPPGTAAQISYFDENGDPVHQDVTLPWSLEFPISAAAGIGSIAAQGDSDTIGCRITVDGVVKADNTTTHEVSSFVSCLLKAA
ncbi:MmpS family transport accessory protein [Mycobacterium sp. SA01]|uniref:MmpS family transport accessory protein n=1 Tax=Mycobacterium sp. SA01 TaxID=3238820 RepID=UPI00351B3AAC